MASMIRWIMAFACLAVGACSQQAMLDKFAPHPQSELAKQVLDELRAKQFDQVKASFDDSLLQSPDIDSKLQEVAGYFPTGALVSAKLVGTNTFTSPSQTTYNLTYEYQFADGWALGNVHLNKRGDVTRVDGVHVQRLAQSLEQQNTFTLAGKDAIHWIVVLFAGAIALFCLYAFVRCLRTPIAKRKWLWAISTLLGIGTLRFQWNTGAFDFQLLSLQLFGASASSQGYSPWIVGLSLPLGAICFLVCRKGLMTNAEDTRAAEALPKQEQA